MRAPSNVHAGRRFPTPDLVEMHPVLYDTTVKSYKLTNVRNNAWKTIASALHADGKQPSSKDV